MQWTSVCNLAGLKNNSGDNPEIVGVSEDSRRIKPGYVFVAVPGTTVDGHQFADIALKNGAVAVVGNREGTDNWQGVPYGYNLDPRRAVALIAHELLGNPTKDMTVIGITGTNGKSSVASLTQSIFRAAGFNCGNFGTLGYDIGDEVLNAPLTTPNAETLVDLFARAHDHKCTHVVMEVSSHALEQERVAGIHFDVAAMTNLTQDHLDYHKDMGAYRQAKLKLFGLAEKCAVLNRDDESASEFEKAAQVKVLGYGVSTPDVEVHAQDIELGFDATRFTLLTPWGEAKVRLQLLGRHTVYNALCAASIAGALEVPLDSIIRGLESLRCVPGRFEPVAVGQDFHVVVDYAHTEDALLNTLKSARQMCNARIIVVFGCGGDRDTGKRPKMGKVAADHADFIVITSDNPRTEDPNLILAAIEEGVKSDGRKKGESYWVIEDRRDAIAFAVDKAAPGDFVLIAGKGHEDYQIIGTQRNHFDDRECARAILEGR